MSNENINEKDVEVVKTHSSSEKLPTTKSEYPEGHLDESHKHELYVKLGHTHVDGDHVVEDAEYLWQKLHEIRIDHATELLVEAVDYHYEDPNFPPSDYEEIQSLAKGPEENPELTVDEWAFKTKMYGVLFEDFSPYPEVRAISSPIDPEMPIETFRAYLLGLIWAAIGTLVNEFFSHRQPSITLSSGVCQMLMYPCGILAQYILPDWGFTIKGTRHSLNPGPWNYKEQMFATIIFDVAIGGIYVSSNIYVQKLKVFYGQTWVTLGYQVLLSLSTQFLGFGFAGVLRKIVIYPTRAVWPTLLPTIALNRALLKPEKKEVLNGWKISRYNFFWIVATCSFVYFWIPDYIFNALSTFNWMNWIAPNNFNLAAITGSNVGLGLNPITTFDWNIISSSAPLAVPFYTLVNQYIGMALAFFCIVGVYYSNYKWTAYMPINSNDVFDNTGNIYDVTQILTNNKFDKAKYDNYGPPYYTAANLVVYGAFFAIYPFAFIYTCWTDRRAILSAFRGMGSSIFSFQSNFKNFKDPHSRMMSKYKETPDWWFLVILLCSIVFAITCVKCYPAGTPVWGIFFTIGINFIFLIPLAIIYSVTGFSFGLNVLVEIIIGYAIPGNGNALMTLKAFGYNIDGQAESFITDQKMAHYAKIPPRAIFRGQFLGIIIQIIISLAIINWEMTGIKDICTTDQRQKFSCPNEVTFYSSSVLWGVIGPKRVFNILYPVLKWCFFIGFLLAPLCIAIKAYFPKQTQYFQPTVIIGGFLNYAPYNLTYYTPGLYVGYVFNHYIKKRYLGWWEKYNYILSAALDSGVAFSAVIIFFAVQYHSKYINWWGNNVPYEGVEGSIGQVSLKDPTTAPDGYFGVRLG